MSSTNKTIDEILGELSNAQSRDVFRAKTWQEAEKLSHKRFNKAKLALLTYIKEEQEKLANNSRIEECYLTIAELNHLGVMTPEAYGYFDKRVAELKQRNRLEQS